jgi:hypothetical protein
MKTFTKKVLGAAIAGSTLFAAGGAGAVNINHDGIGEVLIYPYYTAREGQISFVSVVNTTDRAKAVKVRFLEGKNTAEVLDFNLFLSARDVWTGAIIKQGDGGLLLTADKSCTNPRIPSGGVAFRNGGYVNDNASLRTLDRTLEGYVEMIEMAEIVTGSKTEADVTHVAGVPECDLVTNAEVAKRGLDYGPATGGLFGNGTMVGNNMSTGYNAIAIEGFGYANGVTQSGSLNPNLSGGSNSTAVVVDSPVAGTSRIVAADFALSRDAVSAIIMHSSAVGEYAYGDGLNTDWVITMPTKRPYVNNGTATALAPFQRVWNGASSSAAGTACVDVTLGSYDREEETSTSDDDFSPQPEAGINQLCWEASVISFGGLTTTGVSSVVKSKNAVGYNAYQGAAPGGWAEIAFSSAGSTPPYNPQLVSQATSQTVYVDQFGISAPAAGSVTFFGLPTVGFVVSTATFANATSNYNSSYSLNFKRTINAPLAPAAPL